MRPPVGITRRWDRGRRRGRLGAAQLRPRHDQGQHRDDDCRLRDVGPADAGVKAAVGGIVVHVRDRASAAEIRPPVRVGARGRPPWPLLSWPAAVALAYDLTLLLDTTVEDDARAKVLRDVDGAIAQAGGSIANNQDWGQKVLAFKVRHKPEAHYHLIQFTGPPELPGTLNRSLGINDVVLRHRIIHTPGGEPPPSPASPAAPAARTAADTEPAQA